MPYYNYTPFEGTMSQAVPRFHSDHIVYTCIYVHTRTASISFQGNTVRATTNTMRTGALVVFVCFFVVVVRVVWCIFTHLCSSLTALVSTLKYLWDCVPQRTHLSMCIYDLGPS